VLNLIDFLSLLPNCILSLIYCCDHFDFSPSVLASKIFSNLLTIRNKVFGPSYTALFLCKIIAFCVMLQEPLGQDTLRNRWRTSLRVLSTLTHAFVLLLDIWRWSYACYLTQLYQALHLSSGLARASHGKLVVFVSYGSRQEGGSCARSTHDAIAAARRFLSLYQSKRALADTLIR